MSVATARAVFGRVRDHLRAVVAEEIRARRDLREFAQATSFAELCAVYERFVLGEVARTPSHLGPRDEETIEIAEALAAANRAGYLTMGSQPGCNAEDYNGSEQRAAVEGFCRDDVRNRLQALYRGTRIVVQVQTLSPSWRQYDYTQAVDVTRNGDRVHTGFGARFNRRAIESALSGVADRVIDEVIPMNQVLIYDPEYGNHRLLWDRLEAL